MHESTFEYLKPSEDQVAKMTSLRSAAKIYAEMLNDLLPDGPDKTYTLRKLREVAMWANVAITRHSDGAPRAGDELDRTLPAGFPPDHPAPGDLGSVPL